MDHFIFRYSGHLLIPTIIAGLKGKMLRKYNAVLTLVMLAIIFSDKPKQAIMLAAFIIWQYTLIKGYLLLRKQNNSTFTFCIAVILSILPLILAKIAPFAPDLKFIVFLGMSYVTFRAVQMVFEVRDGLIKELSFFNFGNSFYSSQQFQQDLSIVTVDSKKDIQKAT